MKLSERLQFCRDEVTRSKKWRSDHYDAMWSDMIDLYRGKQYEGADRNDRLVINLVFATKNVIAPSVAINNPRFVVNARKPDQAPMAIIVEEVLNYLWRTHDYQDEIRLAVDDWILCGHGWVKATYKATKPPEVKDAGEPGVENMGGTGDTEGIDDREPIPGNAESEVTTGDASQDRPLIERISIYDMFVDPDSRNPKEMRWIAQRTWRALQDVRVDSRYDAKARKAVGSVQRYSSNGQGDNDGRSTADTPDAGAISYCEVIEFYDLKRNEVCTFAMSGYDDDTGQGVGGLFLIKPQPIPYGTGQPFRMLRNYEVPDTFYPMGEIESVESLQLELNETRNQMLNHRKRFARKWIYKRDAFDEDGVKALESDVDNTMVPMLGQENPNDVITPLPSVGTPPDFYNQSQLITDDINTVSGVSDYMRGQPESAVRRTATEAAMIQDAANSRARDKLNKIESFLAGLGSAVISLMQQFMTGDQVARITSVSGQAWVNYDADYLQGDFDYEVEGGSTEPRNEAFRRQSALQLVDAMAPFVEIGVVNAAGLARYVLQYGFNIKDISMLLNDPQQQMAQQQQVAGPQPMPPEGQLPPGAEQAPMPAEQPPGDPMAQAAQMAGQGPPIEQMPAGQAPEIPPELLAQLGMS